MARLPGFVARLLNLSVADPKSWDSSLWQLRGAVAGGEAVTEKTALTYSAVYNAVSLIAGTVATLPLNLISRTRGRTTVRSEMSAHQVLHTEANEYMTAMALREAMMGHLLLWGNAYCEIVRDGYGQVVALWPITPDRVSVKWSDDGDLVYQIDMGANKPPVVLPRERVLHVPGLGFDGLVGYSVVSMARQSLGLSMALETFGSRYFSEGTHPGAIVTHPGRLSEEGSKSLKAALTDSYSGLGKSHRLMLLQEGMKLERVVIPPEDSQFLESRQHQIPEIARWFNLPPHKLKDLTRSSFSNIESEQISFVTDSILPWLIRLEANFNMQLLTRLEKRRLYYKHSVQGLMRGSAKDRAEYYARMWGIGAMSINDILDKEDEDPVPDGDTRFVPANMLPLARALKKPVPPAPNEPTVPDEGEPAEGEEANQETRAAKGNGKPEKPAHILVPLLTHDPRRIGDPCT